YQVAICEPDSLASVVATACNSSGGGLTGWLSGAINAPPTNHAIVKNRIKPTRQVAASQRRMRRQFRGLGDIGWLVRSSWPLCSLSLQAKAWLTRSFKTGGYSVFPLGVTGAWGNAPESSRHW